MAKVHNPRFVAFTQAARERIREMGLQDVKRQLENGNELVLVDVREDHEWANGFIPDAIHIGKGIIERDIETLVPNLDAPIVLYCGGGFRSAIAADALSQMGYTNVMSMSGGFTGWRAAGFEIMGFEE